MGRRDIKTILGITGMVTLQTVSDFSLQHQQNSGSFLMCQERIIQLHLQMQLKECKRFP